MRMGHEYAGEVVELGKEVTGLRVGDRVACAPTGISATGGFGEYVCLGARGAIRLPASLSMSDGALCEPMSVGLHSLNMARMLPGESIGILGAGSMGLAMVYWARRLGAGKITVLSRSTHRHEVAYTLGADRVVGFSDDEVQAIQGDVGAFDLVAECVGKVGMTERAISMVRPGGTVLSLGMCMSHEQLLPAACSMKEIRLLFPLAFSIDEFREAVDVFERNDVRPDVMVSDVIGLDEVPSTLEAIRTGGIKALKVHVEP
jgi:(R,R)-butanediol dehydrogenase/meso-butanediol dehydrogenase/diacetyl reductase